MPNWSDILNEITASKHPDAINTVRYKYLNQLHRLRQRNVIAYYSGWMHRSETGMFANDKDRVTKVAKIVEGLSRSDVTMAHDRHISVQEASDMGLKIKRMEGKDNNELQDAVLSVHHSYMHTMAMSPVLKMV